MKCLREPSGPAAQPNTALTVAYPTGRLLSLSSLLRPDLFRDPAVPFR